MYGYDRSPVEIGKKRNYRQELSPDYYNALFSRPDFNYDDLVRLSRESDPFITHGTARGTGDIGGFDTFADLQNSAARNNALKMQFAQVKDKQAVSQRLDALKKLGLSDQEAELNVNNPKFLDYFERNGVAPRVTTFVQPMATSGRDGLTIDDKQARQRFFDNVDLIAEKQRILDDARAQSYLDRRDQEMQQNLDYQTALRDEGLRRDYLDPNQFPSRSRGVAGSTRRTSSGGPTQREIDDYQKLVTEARAQDILADGTGINEMSPATPEDIIGQGIAKRYFRADSGMAGIDQLDKQVQAEAAGYGDDVVFDQRTGTYSPNLTGAPDDYGKNLAAQSLNQKLDRIAAIQDEFGAVMDDAGRQGYILKDGVFHDPATGRTYQYSNDPNEEDNYFANLPVNQPLVDRGSLSRTKMTPAQTNRIIGRVASMPGGTEENYADRFDYFADQIANGNPYAAHSGVAQADMDNRRVNELAAAIEKGMVPNIDMERYGYDPVVAARAIIAHIGRKKASLPMNYIGNTRY